MIYSRSVSYQFPGLVWHCFMLSVSLESCLSLICVRSIRMVYDAEGPPICLGWNRCQSRGSRRPPICLCWSRCQSRGPRRPICLGWNRCQSRRSRRPPICLGWNRCQSRGSRHRGLGSLADSDSGLGSDSGSSSGSASGSVSRSSSDSDQCKASRGKGDIQ